MTMYPVWFDKDMLKSMVTRKRKRETDAVAAVEYSEGNVEATTDNTHHTALGMFSVLPEDVIKKIMRISQLRFCKPKRCPSGTN